MKLEILILLNFITNKIIFLYQIIIAFNVKN